jgi:hypothetical protein
MPTTSAIALAAMLDPVCAGLLMPGITELTAGSPQSETDQADARE